MNKSAAEADQLAHPHHHLLLHIITLDHSPSGISGTSHSTQQSTFFACTIRGWVSRFLTAQLGYAVSFILDVQKNAGQKTRQKLNTTPKSKHRN